MIQNAIGSIKNIYFTMVFKWKVNRALASPSELKFIIAALEFLDEKYFAFYKANYGRKVNLVSNYTSVNQLLNEIDKAFLLIRDESVISSTNKLHSNDRYVLSLDDFLTDKNDRPLNIRTVINAVKAKYIPMATGILSNDLRHDYYKRKTEHLTDDVIELIKSIAIIKISKLP